jgi:hypothetical protein|uniref:Uncharacterized protein n=1 Tax=viral metagenome TaxID=1070528 RepID=A0A6C0EPQ1_9ZZZZ
MLLLTILFYILIILLIFIIKPSIMFDIYGNIKTYNSKSLLTLDIIYPIIALLTYYFILVIKVILIS